MARQTVESLESVEADFILSTSASCAVTIRDDYVHLLRDDPDWLERARQLSARSVDFTGFLQRAARLPAGALPAQDPEAKVTYHDACQTNNVLGIRDEQRRIIADVMGLNLTEMADSTMCCGFGGSFSFDHPDVSSRLLDRKLSRADDSDAEIIVTDNPGCIMQMRGGLKARGGEVEVLHLAELMARYLPS
jgi:Fe-S oxidoreductase